MHPRLLELIRAHRSTLVFVNSRRLAERLAARLNELAGEELVRAHHGSIAREQRLEIEEALKAGRLPALVATSSLELGIDMGAIDLVIQIEAPPSVAAGLQRIGRAGHQVGEASTGKIFPKYRGDLLEAAVVVRRMLDGAIEETRIPRNPLDVLAQQLVAIGTERSWSVDELHALVTRAHPFRDLSREQLEGVLDMLSGRYPSDEFAELRPRVVWDRTTDSITSRNDARVVAVTSGGTIPDRGLYGVFLAGEESGKGRRVGELDEEMVYESRVGEVFLLGASSWRIEEIKPDRVVVSPAPGEPGKMPFWKGDGIGRPIELGRAIGAFLREFEPMKPDAAAARLRDDHALDELAARNLVAYLGEQRETTGALPTDRQLVVERFRDELGDWRLCLLSPFGGRVHAPWAMAIEARMAEQGRPVQAIWTDDGIALRLPDVTEPPTDELFMLGPDEVDDILMSALGGSALFAAHFRENAARALLLPRRRPGQRTPLWMQRQRSADLLTVASRYGSFPIILETYREILGDVFDVPALKEVLGGIRSRAIRVASVETRSASPFATGLLFDYIGTYLYEGDAPLAERRAQALSLDRELLAELLGAEELRELLDPAATTDLELELQALAGGRRVRTVDGLHDLVRRVGDLRTDEVAARTDLPEVEIALSGLAKDRRIVDAAAGGRGSMDRDRGRGPLSRRLRRQPAGRRGRDVAPGLGWRRHPAARRSAAALGAHPQPLHRGRAGGTLGHRPVARPGAPARPGRAGRPAGGRLPTGRHRARVRRPRGAARPAPPLAGAPAARSGAGAGRCLRPLPGVVARHRVGGDRARPAAGGDRPAGGLPDARLHPGARRPARPCPRLHPAPAGRAGRRRRGGVDRPRAAGPRRRPGGAVSPRSGRAAGLGRRLRARRAAREPAARRHPAAPRAPRRLVLRRRCAWRSRTRATTTSCSMRCGTSSGPARSPTTPSPRCGR